MKKECLTIGMFGTCGNSLWRKDFIEKYKELHIDYFNPQVDDWNSEFAEIEAEHLANDKIVLFPITYETYGMGSLSEVGFSILNAIKLDDRRNFIILIDSHLDSSLDNKDLIKESLRTRALIKQHLKKLNLENIYMVENLNEMLEVSIHLYHSEKIKQDISKYSLGNK